MEEQDFASTISENVERIRRETQRVLHEAAETARSTAETRRSELERIETEYQTQQQAIKFQLEASTSSIREEFYGRISDSVIKRLGQDNKALRQRSFLVNLPPEDLPEAMNAVREDVLEDRTIYSYITDKPDSEEKYQLLTPIFGGKDKKNFPGERNNMDN